jgi:hypothetical protein
MIEELEAVYLFIAELRGYKIGPNKADKISYGKKCYLNQDLPELDPKSEHDRSEWHEKIWLIRLYKELDTVLGLNTFSRKTKTINTLDEIEVDAYEWKVPIELDASASMLQWIGVLLDDSRLTNMTNVTGTEICDAWRFDGIPRKQFKVAATPMLYGSSKDCYELWQDNSIEYTLEQVQLFKNELNNGALGLANDFKEFIINNCKTSVSMDIKVFTDRFTIECNRFKNIGDKTSTYQIYDTNTDSIRTVRHTTTTKEPDLDQFRRYFVTLLIHNLDSQAANYVSNKIYKKYGWVIPIHDAFIVSPKAAKITRELYAEFMETVYENREEILRDFFISIGIGAEAQDEWNKVKEKVVNHEGKFKVNNMALK